MNLPNDVSFELIYQTIRRAAGAYGDDASIRESFGSNVWIRSLSDKIKVFVEEDASAGVHWVSVRGTDNLANAREDVEYLKEPDPVLGVYFHRGFHRAALEVYSAVKPQLRKEVEIRVTGHSLGAAIAAIMQAWMRRDGFDVQRTINFGQPKVTNQAGVDKLRADPLLRVVNNEDVVPMVPPLTLGSSIHGRYLHFGEELHLLKEAPAFQLYGEREAESPKVTSFWRHIGREDVADHHSGVYLARLREYAQALGSRRA